MHAMDAIPLWAFFIVAAIACFGCVELGYRLHHRAQRDDSDAAVGSMVGSTLALLAFMLAFTFGVASSRFDARRLLVVKEANAIGTAYLRCDLLEEPARTQTKQLFREYVNVRISGAQDLAFMKSAQQKSEDLHKKLWAQAAAAGQAHPNYPVYTLFINAVNEVIDVHSERVAALYSARVPLSVWLALFAVAGLAMVGTGYYSGLTGKRNAPETIIMILSFSTVLLIVTDLDRPFEGTIRTPQEPIMDLKKSMGT